MKKPTKKEEPENRYTMSDLVESANFETKKHYIILNYLINKNSHPLPRGFDHERFLDDMQDYEDYLASKQ